MMTCRLLAQAGQHRDPALDRARFQTFSSRT